MMLYDTLKNYTSSDAYPFHMPGHKRRAAFLCDPASIDITEIDGFDNLHHAEGILKEAQERAAVLYGSSETHFLVNGSTAGILAAIGACTRPGSLLLMARNSHRSAFHAASLNRVRCAYLVPGRDEVSPDTRQSGAVCASGLTDPVLFPDLNAPVDPARVERMLEQLPDVSAVFVTTPSYDGVVSDLGQIAEIVHRFGIPLIVDEAHGAHFGMHRIFPPSSVALGADLVIHSLHKTLPALTQTALIHVNGPLVDRGRLRRLLGVYQTSSPSYVLMASIDQCVRLLLEKKEPLFDAFAGRLAHFHETLGREGGLKQYSLLPTDDPSRILIRPGGAECGLEAGNARSRDTMHLYHTLRTRFRLQPEMVTPSYVLMLSSVCDDDEGFARLSEALLTMDGESAASRPDRLSEVLSSQAAERVEVLPSQAAERVKALSSGTAERTEGGLPCETPTQPDRKLPDCALHDRELLGRELPDRALPEAVCTIAQALDADTETVSFSSSEGRVSAEFLTLYPPGVPLLIPGERITAGIIRHALLMKEKGYSLQGPEDYSLQSILVLK